MKKVKMLLMAAMIVGMLLCVAPIRTMAAEPTTITPNEVITDSIDATNSEKQYKFVVDKAGYFTISVNKHDPLEDVGNEWRIKLKDDKGDTLREWTTNNSLVSAKFGFAKDGIFYIEIKKAHVYNNANYGKQYDLCVHTVEDLNWEQEYNDTMATATVMEKNTEYKATLISGSDVDYFKYKVSDVGYFKVNFSKEDPLQNTSNAWVWEMYDEDGTLIDSMSEIQNSETSKLYNFPKGKVVYFKVYKKHMYNNAVVEVPYVLTVNSVADENYEIENLVDKNGTMKSRLEHAKNLSSKKIFGTLYCVADNDVYIMKAKTGISAKLSFDVNNISSELGSGYSLEIYDTKGERIFAENGIKSDKTFSLKLKAGTYYVTIFGKDNKLGYNIYSISMKSSKYGLSSMSKQKLSYNSKKMLTWKKVKYAKGYEVQVSTDKNFKKSKTKTYKVVTNKKKLTGIVKKGRKYYIRVRAYRSAMNGKVYSTYTKTRIIK